MRGASSFVSLVMHIRITSTLAHVAHATCNSPHEDPLDCRSRCERHSFSSMMFADHTASDRYSGCSELSVSLIVAGTADVSYLAFFDRS